MSKQLEIAWVHPKFPHSGHLVNVGTVQTGGDYWFRIEVCQVDGRFDWVLFAVSSVAEVKVHRGFSDRPTSFSDVLVSIDNRLAEEKKRIAVYTGQELGVE